MRKQRQTEYWGLDPLSGQILGLRGNGPDYVFPNAQNFSPEERPYGFSPYFLWKSKKFDISKANGVDSDRLHQWKPDRFKAALDAAGGRLSTLRGVQASLFLSTFYEKPITALAVARGCNVSSGYEIYSFFFQEG